MENGKFSVKTVCALIFPQHLSHEKDLLVFSVEFCESLWTSFFPEFGPKQILARLPPFCVNEKIWCKRESEPPGDVEGLSQFASIWFTALFKLTLCYAVFNLPFCWTVCVKRFQMIFEREMIVTKRGELILWHLIITQNITLRYDIVSIGISDVMDWCVSNLQTQKRNRQEIV